MKNIDLHYICTVIGNLAGIPIRLFDGELQIFIHTLVKLPKDPMFLYRDEIWNIRGNVGYFVTKHFNYYGIVNSGNYKIIIGPTRQVSNNEQELRELAFRADVPIDEVDDFVNAMKSIVPMPLSSIMQMLCTINYILNDEKLQLEDITIYDEEQAAIKNFLEQQRTTHTLSYVQSNSEPQQTIHNTYELEQTLMNIVRKGNTLALREWISSAPAVRGGLLASEQLRQMKNTFIVTTTLASRAAIRGGMDTEDAFSLSDSYIQQCELLNAPDRITNLQYHMILEYT